MKWAAFYIKYLSETDPFAIEIHCWECEAESSEEAVTTLKQNPVVPYRMFLAEVVPSEQKKCGYKTAERKQKD